MQCLQEVKKFSDEIPRTGVSIITHTSAVAFSSDVTSIVQLIGKRILYNIPIGAKYFHSDMIMLTEIFY